MIPAPSGRPLVLASTSRHRRALLDRIRCPYVAVDPQLDETPWHNRPTDPESMVASLAKAKAAAVSLQFPDAIVIGADQCAELEGAILGKPGSRGAAEAQLCRLAGRAHRLVTGVCVLDVPHGVELSHVDVHVLRMRALSPEQIARYVEIDDPLDCAGAYRIESLGVALFESISGQDSTAIVGLPMMALVRMLSERGLSIP